MKEALLKISRNFPAEEAELIKQNFEKISGHPISFKVETDDSLIGGFCVYMDGKIYDAAYKTQLQKIHDRIDEVISDSPQGINEFIGKLLSSYKTDPEVYDYGTAFSCADGIVSVKGLSSSRYGELLEFEGKEYGIAIELHEEGVGAVMLSKESNVVPGDVVRGTGRVADICTGPKILGRVIDPIGRPLDGRPLPDTERRNIECPAPTIMQRKPVSKPLMTGVLSVDSMIPIGRGQRELIIGDRQTGKTTLALSAMINQKKDDVLCVYCAIGQKASTIRRVMQKLKDSNSLQNTVIVATTADDSACMQYLTPYAACAVAESFMYQGKDVLIIYDDLTKHAAAYRSMSLLLRRPSGREAYPGDVFYLHSRLLERAASLSDEMGGGSMTALPIIETMSGDISAYIPTNVISITDGQIYLETELFNSGVRPAVNVGLSVSRVGRSAQNKAMKDVSQSLRLELAQYRDTAVFAQFGADIDKKTLDLLKRGERLTEILKQDQDEVLSLGMQVALLLAYKNDGFLTIDKKRVCEARKKLLAYIDVRGSGTIHSINTSGEMTESDRKILEDIISDFFEEYSDAKH